MGDTQTIVEVQEENSAPDASPVDIREYMDRKPEEKKEEPEATPVEEKPDDKDWKTEYNNLQKVLGRQGQLIGELKAQLNKMNEKPAEPEKPEKKLTLDEFVEDPEAALKRELDKRERRKADEMAKQEIVIRQNVEMVYEKVPNFEELLPTIIELAKEDGFESVDQDMVMRTARLEPVVAIQYAKRAALALKVNGEKAKGEQAIDRIARGTRKQPVVTGSSAGAPQKTKLTESDIQNMTDAEIKELLFKKAGYR